MADSLTARTLATIPHESITVDFALRATLHRFFLRIFLWSRTRWHYRTGMVRLWVDIALIALASAGIAAMLPHIHHGIIGLLALASLVYLASFHEFAKLRDFAEAHVSAVTNSKKHRYEILQRLALRFIESKQASAHKALEALTRHCVTLAITNTTHSFSTAEFADTIRSATKDFPDSEREEIEQELAEMRKLSTQSVDLPPYFHHKRRFLHALSLAAVAAVCVLPVEISLVFVGSLAELFAELEGLEQITNYFSTLQGGFMLVAKGFVGALIVRRVGRLEDMTRYNEGGKPAFSDHKQRTFQLLSGGLELYRLKDLYLHAGLKPNFQAGCFVFVMPRVIHGEPVTRRQAVTQDSRFGIMFLIHSQTELLELHRLYW